MMTRFRTILLVLLIALIPLPVAAQVVATEYEGASALGLALRQLGTTKRVLMIAAHPDDEATQVLSSLALGDGAAVAYLSLTRGEGGQNGIGPELQEGLGLLRSEELLAARRLDGALQYFSRAIDYGFSKNADEAFTHWPREELLADVVAVVRHFRPDVIVSVFSGTPRDGHGQHQAAGIIATEAFEAAADGSRFPEQIALGLRPHAAIHLYQLVRTLEDAPTARIEAGEFDPLLGMSHFQVAMASRSRHRSQDMGRALTPGPQGTPVIRVASRLVTNGDINSGFFAGVDTTLFAHARRYVPQSGPDGDGGQLASLINAYQATVDDARRSFNPLAPRQVVPFLVQALGVLDRIGAVVTERGGDTAAELGFLVAHERGELEEALRRAARIEVDAVADDETIVPGQTFTLEVRFWNGGDIPVPLVDLRPIVAEGWGVLPLDPLPEVAEAGALVRRRFEITVAEDAELTQPYFLRLPPEGARYRWPGDYDGVGIPFEPDPVEVAATFTVQQATLETRVPANYLGVDTRSGEFRRPLRIVPAVAVTADPKLAVLPLNAADRPIPITVRLLAEAADGISGTLRIDAPAGWRIEPASVDVEFAGPGEQRVIEFTAKAPADVEAGTISLSAVFADGAGRRFTTGYTLVDYPHIRPRPLVREAVTDVQAIDVSVPDGLSIGYVAATGDNVPQALAQLGITIDLIDEPALASGNLDTYDVIVVGSRAYEGRPDLVTHNGRLLDYVERGGTMIVQYNQYQFTEPGIAPYPVTMARPHDRVTDETAEMTILVPNHTVFMEPNEITTADFDGWVQERGLYFLNTWDDRYTPLLEASDPGEDPKRGILMVTDYGSGTYVYTGLALFRQLPAGVPGAYRIFANLLSLGADR